MVGVFILLGMIKVYGYNWEVVGVYNVGFKKENYFKCMVYVYKVWKKYQQLKLVVCDKINW